MKFSPLRLTLALVWFGLAVVLLCKRLPGLDEATLSARSGLLIGFAGIMSVFNLARAFAPRRPRPELSEPPHRKSNDEASWTNE